MSSPSTSPRAKSPPTPKDAPGTDTSAPLAPPLTSPISPSYSTPSLPPLPIVPRTRSLSKSTPHHPRHNPTPGAPGPGFHPLAPTSSRISQLSANRTYVEAGALVGALPGLTREGTRVSRVGRGFVEGHVVRESEGEHGEGGVEGKGKGIMLGRKVTRVTSEDAGGANGEKEEEGDVVAVQVTPDGTELAFPDGGREAWLCLMGGCFSMFCGYGLAPAAGASQSWYKNNLLSDYSQSQIAWIGAVQSFVTFGISVFTGSLFDLYGHRPLIAAGTFSLTLGYCMLSLCTEYYQIILCHATLIPFGMDLMFIAPVGCVGQWFALKRGLAFGTMTTGASLGACVWPLIWANGPQRIGFGWTMRLIALIVGILGTSAFFLLKTRLPPKPPGPFFHFQAFKSFSYCCIAFTSFTYTFGFFIQLFFVGTYGQLQGWKTLSPYFLIIINGVSSLFRIPSGILADRFGLYNVAFIASCIMTLVCWVWLAAKTIPGVVIICCMFGLTSATWVSLQAPCTTVLATDMRFAATMVGMVMFVQSIAQLIGPPIAGSLLGTGSTEEQLTRFPHAIILASAMFTLATISLGAGRLNLNRKLWAIA
ncbi:hypothetical protein IAT38_000191 [Cryptococcus sp. DSM 104549]